MIRVSGVRLIACPAPAFAPDLSVVLPEGGTILDLLLLAGADEALLRHGDVRVLDPARPLESLWIPREHWHVVRPKRGMVVVAHILPGKGGGGGGGKSPMRIVLSLAVIVAAAAATYGMSNYLIGAGFTTTTAAGATTLSFGGTLIAGAAGAATSMLGNLVVNALVPPPRPAISEYGQQTGGGSTPENPRYSLQGSRNTVRPWQPVRKVMGRRRVVPDLFGEIYREVVGADTFMRIPLMVCEGPAKLSEWKVGETPLADLRDIEIETREGWPDDAPITLYTNDHHLDQYSITLTQAASWFSRRSAPDADELVVEIGFPRGLTQYTGTASRTSVTVGFDLEYAPAGIDTWTPLPLDDGTSGDGVTVTDEVSGSSVLRAFRAKVARGQYDVRVRRTTADASDNQTVSQSQWVGLCTVTYRDPLMLTGVARAVLRAKAGQETNGVLDQISCLVEAYADVHDPATGLWSWQISRNPADWYADALIRWSPRPISKDRLNLTVLADWRTHCAATGPDGQPRFFFDAVYEHAVTLRQVLDDTCGAGRARRGFPEGRWGVIRDVAQASPVQAIGPANSWGFREVETYSDLPHGLRCQFEDEAQDYRIDEAYYFAPGYDKSTATKYEVLELVGVTRATQAYLLGRYHMAVALHRPGTYEVHLNVAALDCDLGDQVRLQHPVIRIGLGDGFVVEVIRDDEGRAVGVRLDDQVIMEAEKRYGILFRRRHAEIAGRVSGTLEVETVPGETGTLTFWDHDLGQALPLAASAEPVAGDYAQFGESDRVALLAVISAIAPEADLGARITLVDAAPEIHATDDGPIPPRNLMMTKPPTLAPKRPPPVPMASVASDESVMVRAQNGMLIPRIVVSLALPSGGGPTAETLAIAIRRSGGSDWLPRPSQPYGPTLTLSEVDQGAAYDLRWRAVTRTGVVSDWRGVDGHVVIGVSSPPPSPEAVYVETLPGGTLRYRVTGPTAPDHAGWRWRWRQGASDAWDGATDASPGIETTGQMESAAFVARTFTVMVKAVDSAGNESTACARAVVRVGFTLQQAVGHTATTVLLADKDPSGPLVVAFDALGAPASALIDATINGILTV